MIRYILGNNKFSLELDEAVARNTLQTVEKEEDELIPKAKQVLL